jgi:predicted N-acetyltransferase YhbS
VGRAFSPFCRVCLVDGRLVAAVRFTEVAIGGREGALLLGPLAVDPAFANRGHGRALAAAAMEDARAAGIALVVLVGDEAYYGRLGFRRVPRGQIALPGPVDPDRLLAAELVPNALVGFSGLVTSPDRGERDPYAACRDDAPPWRSWGRLWRLDAKVFADLVGELVVDLIVPRNGRPPVEGGIVPPRVAGTLAQLDAAMRAQVLQEPPPLHTAIFTSRKSLPAADLASCRFISSASRRVIFSVSINSSRVRP